MAQQMTPVPSSVGAVAKKEDMRETAALVAASEGAVAHW